MRFTETASCGPVESATSTSTETVCPGRATPVDGTIRIPGWNLWTTYASPESCVPSTVAFTMTPDGWLWNTKTPVNNPTDCRVRLSGERPGNRSTNAATEDGSVGIPRSNTYAVTFTLSPNSATVRSTSTMTSTASVTARASRPAPIVVRRNPAMTKTASRIWRPVAHVRSTDKKLW